MNTLLTSIAKRERERVKKSAYSTRTCTVLGQDIRVRNRVQAIRPARSRLVRAEATEQREQSAVQQPAHQLERARRLVRRMQVHRRQPGEDFPDGARHQRPVRAPLRPPHAALSAGALRVLVAALPGDSGGGRGVGLVVGRRRGAGAESARARAPPEAADRRQVLRAVRRPGRRALLGAGAPGGSELGARLRRHALRLVHVRDLLAGRLRAARQSRQRPGKSTVL